MKARVPPLGFVLACVVSAAAAQQSTPAPVISAGLRQILDAPVWYFNYTVTLRLQSAGTNPSGVSHTELRERFTSGSMMLGIRSSGPSLSLIDNPGLMVFTQPGQLDAVIARFANWISGPPPEDETLPPAQQRTPEQQDAYFAQVRQDNVKAFHRHRYDYFASRDGGNDRTTASGYGPVTHGHEPALEFDGAKQRFRLHFAPLNFVDSAATVNAFVGARETGIGTIHYVRQEIKTGILTGDDGITSIQPAPGVFEGNLPFQLGNIAHSSTHTVTTRTGNGTLSVQFTLSPFPPAPIDLIIEPPADYVKWLPLGAENEKTAGDGIPIKVVLQKRGGGTPQFKPVRITYQLWKTSREKGVCLNWPPNPEPLSPFDLQFEQDENPTLLVVGNDRQVAVNSAPVGYTDTVMVSCFDYGAHGELAATAELENGQVVHGIVKFTANETELKLPFRPAGSIIASAFFDAHGLSGVQDDDDSEKDPVGDGFSGDGLTLYEEYRGFMVGDDWTPGNPKKKEMFVMNELRGDPATLQGIRLFETVSSLKVHDLLRANQVTAAGQINFHRTAGPHVVDQHAIRIQRGALYWAGNQIAQVTGDVGTPGTAKTVSIQPDLDLSFGAPFMASTLAHELLHACNVFHHGERDMLVWWSYEPPATQIFESAVGFDSVQQCFVSMGTKLPITVKKEDGSVVNPSLFFKAGINGAPITLGLPHGQHSGADNCIMRYDNAQAYVAKIDPYLRYLTRETTGFALCTSPAGTGVNAANRTTPESRYRTAATPQNGGPSVLANRGDCAHQLRVNDLASEPRR